MTGGRIICSNNFSKTKKQIPKNINLGIFATDSANIELNNMNINRMNVRLNNAEVRFNSRLNRLQAKLVNHAYLRLNAKQLLDIKIEKDTLSKLSYWD